MHLTAPSHWSRSIVTGGRDASERVVTIAGMRTAGQLASVRGACGTSLVQGIPNTVEDVCERSRWGQLVRRSVRKMESVTKT
jgi:hypothetical protein